MTPVFQIIFSLNKTSCYSADMITATVLTKDSEKTLRATLDSLQRFPEVIVLDSGSSDGTLTLARSYPNVKVFTTTFGGFGPLHNYASSLATHDWILSIDSDEVLTPGLVDELLALRLDPNTLYGLVRQNYYNQKLIKYCGGWHPDVVYRLYHRGHTRFTDDLVHEKVEPKQLKKVVLSSPLLHTPYQEIKDFLHKMQHYSTLFAEQNQSQKVSVFRALGHGWFAFFKSYILKRGFLGGKEGLIISLYNGHTTLYKYLKIVEKQTIKK